MEPGRPLHWYRAGKALVVARIAGNQQGQYYLDLNNRNDGEGIHWAYWSVRDGKYLVEAGRRPACPKSGK